MVRISVLNDTLKVRFRENRDATSVARAFARAISERTSSLRGDPCFVVVRLSFFCVCLLCFCSASKRVLTPFSLSLSLCVCVCAMNTGDVQRRKAWKASGVGAPGVQGGHQVLASHAKARYVTNRRFLAETLMDR